MSAIAAHTANTSMAQASAITYTGGAATVLFWGLNVSEIAVILSSLAAIGGFFLQFYVVYNQMKDIRRQQKAATIASTLRDVRITAVEDKADAAKIVVDAVAEAQRVAEDQKKP